MRDFIRSGTKPLSLLALAALTACGGGSDGDSSTYNAEIRRTAMGVPHIKADSWAGVGYGSGYAQAEDNLCTMAAAQPENLRKMVEGFAAGYNRYLRDAKAAGKAHAACRTEAWVKLSLM